MTARQIKIRMSLDELNLLILQLGQYLGLELELTLGLKLSLELGLGLNKELGKHYG